MKPGDVGSMSDLLAEIDALTAERDEARALCAEAAKMLAKMQRWEFEALIAKLERP